MKKGKCILIFVFVFMGMFCLHVCLTNCMVGTHGEQLTTLELELRTVFKALWILEINPQSSGSTLNHLNH